MTKAFFGLKILVFIAVVPVQALAQNGPFTDEGLRQMFASHYVKEFAQQFNELQIKKDTQDIYGMFMPKKQRPDFFRNWPLDLRATYRGRTLIFERQGKQVMQVEVLDLLEQRYRINGKLYSHDWNGDLLLQQKKMRALFSRKQAWQPSIWSLLVPEVEAQWEPAVDEGLELGEAACDAYCAPAIAAAEGSALWVAADAQEVEAVASQASVAFKRSAMAALKGSTRAAGNFFKNIYEDIYTDPELYELRKMIKKGLSTPANYPKAPFKALGFLVKRFEGPIAIGSITFLFYKGLDILFNENDKVGITNAETLSCLVHFQWNMKTCSYAKPRAKIPQGLPTSDGGQLDDYWCVTKKVNEINTTILYPDGSRIVRIMRTPPGGQNKGTLVSATQFKIDKNGQIVTNSFRDFQVKDFEVSRVIQPGYKTEFSPSDVLVRRLHLPPRDDEENNVHDQVLRRDVNLNQNHDAEKDKTILTKEQIENYVPPDDKDVSDGVKQMKQEVSWANFVVPYFKSWSKTCDDMDDPTIHGADASAPPVQPAAK